ncbi:MAG: hypothetical protein AAF349_10650 [Cyanobacteria bacterium P01_A01_bin.68]
MFWLCKQFKIIVINIENTPGFSKVQKAKIEEKLAKIKPARVGFWEAAARIISENKSIIPKPTKLS